MFSRFGLRSRMAVSYVVVSAAALLAVEVVLLTLVAPQMRSASDNAARAAKRAELAVGELGLEKAKRGAGEDAANLSLLAADLASNRPRPSSDTLLDAVASRGFERTSVFQGRRRGAGRGEKDDVIEALAAPSGRVVASSAPGVLPVGSSLPGDATGPLPRSGSAGSGAWATAPVETTAESGGPNRVIGIVYLRLSFADPEGAASGNKPGGKVAPATAVKSPAGTQGMLMPGLIVLVLLLPVGVLFGLLSTGRLIRRIRRLAESTQKLADGDLRTRVQVSGGDEVGRLEEGFNWMAQRLHAAVQAERDAAGAQARRAERTRITRDLHDSVSQDLFSLSLLAGGMRRALPADSALRRQAEAMERTVDHTMREMRAMLLELRPVTLEDAGLVAALEELCRAYEARLGIQISADVGELQVEPAVELAVLRVAQEALGNAARHGEAQDIELSVTEVEGHVVMAISDRGRGFDPVRIGARHGMGLALMRERVAELGGTFDLASAPGEGTTVRVRIPGGVS